MNWSWEQIYEELCKDNSDKNVLKNQRIIIGFMSYKLKPFLNKNSNQTTKEQIKEQIKKNIDINWIKKVNNKREKLVLLFIIILILIILFSYMLYYPNI